MDPGPAGALDLAGVWKAQEADDELRRRFPEDGFDDLDWESITVPAHWQSTPAFAQSQGPLLYRRRFEAPPPEPGERAWLTLDGCCYQGDVWLDSAYVGDTEGYFIPHTFEVTDLLTARREHVLAIEATCTPPGDLTAKRNLTGVLQHWDALDADRNPGGLWRGVRVTSTGPVRIDTFRVVVVEADDDRAIVQVDAWLNAAATHTVVVRTLVDHAADHAPSADGGGSAAGRGDAASLSEEHVLATGANLLTWRIAVEEPHLWWPRALGSQPLYDVAVEIHLAGRCSDRRVRRVGMRRVALRNWVASINGERLFLKGSVYGPTRPDFGASTDAELTADLDRAADAGLDFLRLIAHVAHPRLYDLADERGMLLWQEMPLQWGYARGIREQAVRQATALVDTLGHHPSVFLWCGHNEPFPIAARVGRRPDVEPTRRFLRPGLGVQELPSWNRSVLDRAIRRALERADASRPAIPHSGVLPHPPQLDGTDSHLWFGWFHGRVADLGVLAARLPRLVRFVSEFGAQAVPEELDISAVPWPPDSAGLIALADAGLHVEAADAQLPFTSQTSAGSWAEASRRYQAAVVKHSIETLRRLKYRPTGGFAQYMFHDVQPGISAALLDDERRPKPAWEALRAACRPVIVVADPLPSSIDPGADLHLAVHAVSDLRKPLGNAEVTATLRWRQEHLDWRFGGEIEADSVARVGTARFAAPTVPGPLRLDLTLVADGVTANNSYVGRVVS